MNDVKLVFIERCGAPSEPVAMSEFVAEALKLTCHFYETNGCLPPWASYLIVVDDVCVGSCAFKSPPVDGGVEIAYWIFPPYEGRGLATQAAAQLVAIARGTLPEVKVFAQTLPEENASVAVLKKKGFVLEGAVDHPEDGTVWQWRYVGRD